MDPTGLGLVTPADGEVHEPDSVDGPWAAAFRDLSEIYRALRAEGDFGALLQVVLEGAKSVTRSRTASLYLVERDASGARGLRYVGADGDSLPDTVARTFCLPLDDRSIAGRVATTGEAFVLDEIASLQEEASSPWDAEAFEARYGFRATSVLTVPMLDRQGRVLGVLQVVDRTSASADSRSDAVAPAWSAGRAHARARWSQRDIALADALACQAAAAIETGRRLESAETLLDGLARATANAVDGRIPSTAGHSDRLADLTCALARLIDAQTRGPFAATRFPPDRLRQLRYACLLHDLGKIGVPEALLEKRSKLTPFAAARIADRFELVRTLRRLEAAEKGHGGLDEALGRLGEYERLVRSADVPGPPDRRVVEKLRRVTEETWTDAQGQTRPLLTDDELRSLGIVRGSLDDEERQAVESHVDHTCEILREVPWTPDLAGIATIVRGNHERLDGSGYPDGIIGDRLPLESRMMAVCDTYDALTASDRPYRKAMVPTDALLVLEQEARQGALDADVVELFVESEVYRSVGRSRPSSA